jgi:copper homeostasis protein
MPLIEVCVEGIDGAVTAAAAGADRVELCASLMEGGITPSVATIRRAVEAVPIPIHVMVRPRGRDFLYSPLEFETMLADVRAAADAGAAGVVFGCLNADGRIDEARMTALGRAAGPLATTCHRAFDLVPDVEEAVEALVRAGIGHVLTSGQRPSGVEGAGTIRRTVAAARGRLKVMACGELDAANIAGVLARTGADELHFAALRTISGGMTFRNLAVGMGEGAPEREFELVVTDADAVRATIAAVRAAG